jgi:magnesium transporter
MKKRILKKKLNLGTAPGTLIQRSEGELPAVRITRFDYNEDRFEERKLNTIDEAFPQTDRSVITWINIDGVHDTQILHRIGSLYNVHPLILEDIQNTGQRPKMDRFDEYLFVCLKMLWYDDRAQDTVSEQVSILLGASFVISFQEREGDVFEPIRQRLRENKGKIRRSGTDYLAYCLIDSIIDNYYIILERIEEQIEPLEDTIVTAPRADTARNLHELKRKLLLIRRAVWPLREVITAIEKEESPLIHRSTRLYLRDIYEHTVQVIDTIETFRDLVSGLHDIYLSTVSNNMNAIMKVLTIIATIFIPLTFIAGIYGMNFQFMPELSWRWGYPLVVGIMFIVALGMVFYFKRRKWF